MRIRHCFDAPLLAALMFHSAYGAPGAEKAPPLPVPAPAKAPAKPFEMTVLPPDQDFTIPDAEELPETNAQVEAPPQHSVVRPLTGQSASAATPFRPAPKNAAEKPSPELVQAVAKEIVKMAGQAPKSSTSPPSVEAAPVVDSDLPSQIDYPRKQD